MASSIRGGKVLFAEISIIILLTGVLIFLIVSTFRKKNQTGDFSSSRFIEQDIEKTTECPLCGKALKRGERVHSVIYSQGEDRLMNIYGCSWCYPNHPGGFYPPGRERTCPSCKTPLKEGSFAIARVFERPRKKIHVHVLGCPVCRNRK